MKIIFVTNYAINHQTGLWDIFVNLDKNMEFIYLATESYDDERLSMHYIEEARPYILHTNKLSDEQLDEIFKNADLVFFGMCEDKRLFKYFKNIKKVVFIQEHTFKKHTLRKFLAIFKQTRINIKTFPTAERFLLAPSYYSYRENVLSGLTSKRKMFKFGYFPKLGTSKNANKNKAVVWSGRMLNWKHPEHGVYLINKLQSSRSDYKLELIGEGPKLEQINRMIDKYKISAFVNNQNFINNSDLMNIFLKSEIGLFSSDIGEGWGVVLNEMLSCGCVVFANIKAGSTSYLIKDGYNGFTYKTKRELVKKVNKYFLMNNDEKEQIKLNAINTIKDTWNCNVAANRLFELSNAIIEDKSFEAYNNGPLSGF